MSISQLQMAAISRNTASVAQDFHNAGGEKINESQNANNQNITIESRNLKRSKRYDDTNKSAKNAFAWKIDCAANRNRTTCENVPWPIYYCKSSTIVRQRISPPAKQMAHLNRLADADGNTNAIINKSNDSLKRHDGIRKAKNKTQPNRLTSPKSDFHHYIRQMQLTASNPFNGMEMTNIFSKSEKLR